MKNKRKKPGLVRRRAAAMLKPFRAQVFESKKRKERRKKRQDPSEGWETP
jgi:hypothetical protein